MGSVVKKVNRKSPANNPLSHSFNTAEEGAQAKADYVLETVLKDFNWEAFVAKKQRIKKQD